MRAQNKHLFDIKFSYVDEDLRPVLISIPKSKQLSRILDDIRNQTQLIIKKLSERYYTLSKSSTVDICARVLDNFEENTVTGASVQVLGSSIATITDLDGNFSLSNIPRKASIRIRHLGYKTKYVTAEDLVSSNPCSAILLALNYQELDEVILFRFLTTGMLKQTDASIELNTAELGILPGLIEPDVLQTIQALPGIKSIDETVSDINIRGGTNDQNLILWDGIKMYQSGHFFGLISAFNPYLTDKVTIIKNGTSAQYGDGVSGIIDMRTNDEIAESHFGGAGFNLISGDIHGHFPITDNLGVQFSARRSVTDFLNTPTYDQFSTRTFQDTGIVERDENFYFYDFTGKVLYDINDRQQLSISFININNNLEYLEVDEGTGSTDISTLDQTNVSIGGNLESRWTDRFTTVLNTYYTQYDLDSRISFNDNQQILLQNNQVRESSVKLNTQYALLDKLLWNNGYQLTEVGIANITDVTQPPFERSVKGIVRTHAYFTEIDFETQNKKLNTKVGGRFNYLENPGTFSEMIIEPRLSVNYKIAKNLSVEVLGEFKHQATNQVVDLEQNFLGIEKRRWILSNTKTDTLLNNTANDPILPIVRSKQGSLGIHYDGQSWYVGLDGFYKQVTGISTVTQGFQNQDQFNGEIGRYDVKGLEFLINHKTPNFSTWFSYAYNLNNYTFNAIDPGEFPNNLDIRHTVTLASTYTYNRLKVGLGINYRTGNPFTEPIEDNPINTTFFPNRINFSAPNSSRLPDYFRADASILYNFDLSTGVKATVGTSVLNLLNKKNILNTFYRLSDMNEIETVERISLGRTPNITFRVSF